jgi:hypothetical protein
MVSRRWERNHDRERVFSTRDLLIFLVEGVEYLIERQDEMEAKMSEFDTALSAEGDAIANLGSSLTTTLNDLAAEVANLQSNPQIPAGALDTLNAHVASLQGLAAQVSAADPGAQPAPVDTPAPAPADTPTDAPAPVDTTGAGSGNQVPDPDAASNTPAPMPVVSDVAPDASPTGA